MSKSFLQILGCLYAGACHILIFAEISIRMLFFFAYCASFSGAAGSAEDLGTRKEGAAHRTLLCSSALSFQLPVDELIKIFIRKVHGLRGLFFLLETSHSSSVPSLCCSLARWPWAGSLPGAVPDHHGSWHIGCLEGVSISGTRIYYLL